MSIKQKIKGVVSLVPIHASEIQMTDVKGNFKKKNVEGALEELKEDKTNILNQFNEYGKKDGTLQIGLNADKIGGFDSDRILIDRNVSVEGDFNNYTKNGIYSFHDSTLIKNAPPISWGILKVYSISIYSAQEVVSMGSNLSYRREKDNNTWSEWKQLATTESSELTLLNGWLNNIGDTKIYKNGNTVTLNITLSSGSTLTNTPIANIPVGFRPSSEKFITIRSCGQDYAYNTNGHVLIRPDGNINLDSSVTFNTRLVLNATYGI